jgi:hypothetical protein
LCKNKNPYLVFYMVACLSQLLFSMIDFDNKKNTIINLLKNIAIKLNNLRFGDAAAVKKIYYDMINMYLPLTRRKARVLSKLIVKCEGGYKDPQSVFGFKMRQHYLET